MQQGSQVGDCILRMVAEAAQTGHDLLHMESGDVTGPVGALAELVDEGSRAGAAGIHNNSIVLGDSSAEASEQHEEKHPDWWNLKME